MKTGIVIQPSGVWYKRQPCSQQVPVIFSCFKVHFNLQDISRLFDVHTKTSGSSNPSNTNTQYWTLNCICRLTRKRENFSLRMEIITNYKSQRRYS